MPSAEWPAPRIVVTLMVAARQPEPEIAARKNALCVDAIVRHGAAAIPLDAAAPASVRAAAFASMDGLLLTGGTDLDPARYGAPVNGSRSVEPDRDAGFSPSPAGDLVEAFEGVDGPFRMAVQCHPERTESTPRDFERLFAFFVDACRGPLLDR